jgi:SSS family transporter
LAFGLYLLITFGLAHLAHLRSRGASFLEDFFVAGREIGPWVLALTWTATMASGGTFIGTPALAHTYGWPVMLWICSYMVVATAGMGLLGKRVAEIGRRTGALTFPDLLRDRFESKTIGIVSGVAVLILYTAYLVAQYIAGARVIEAVLGVPYLWGVLAFAVTVSLYTVYGGFRAVAWTDSFQAMVMLGGVLVTCFFAVRKAGGLQAVYLNFAAQSPDLLSLPGPGNFLPLPAAISFFCIWALATAGQPSLVTRFLACRDAAAIKRASFLIGLYILLLYPAIIVIGITGRALLPQLEAADHAMPATILTAVPPLLAGFVLAAPLAAIMSTVSSFLLVSTSAVVRDLYQQPRAAVDRAAGAPLEPFRYFRRHDRSPGTRAAAAAVPAVHRDLLGHRPGRYVLFPDPVCHLLAAHEYCWLSGGDAGRFCFVRAAVPVVRHPQFWRF